MVSLWRKIGLFTILVLFLMSSGLYAQQLRQGAAVSPSSSDVKVWTGIVMSNAVTKRLSIGIKTSYFTRLPFYSPRFSDVGLQYNFYKRMKVGGFYRFTKYFETNQRRVYLQVTDKIPLVALGHGLMIQPRLRWQQKVDRETGILQQHIRPRIRIKSKFENIPIQPFISAEAFFCYAPDAWDKYRMTAGFDYSFNDNYTLRFFFRHQKELLAAAHETDKHNTFNLSYRFKF